MLNIAIIGATGRMGRCIIRAALDEPDLKLRGGLVSPASEAAGIDLGELAGRRAIGIAASGDPEQALAGADIVIDFSLPASTDAVLAACVARRLPVVIGTTGLTDRQRAALDYAASQIPIFYAANMSVGLNLLRSLAKSAATSLGPEFDAEILDVHHRFKRDAPSGSALELGAAGEVRAPGSPPQRVQGRLGDGHSHG